MLTMTSGKMLKACGVRKLSQLNNSLSELEFHMQKK